MGSKTVLCVKYKEQLPGLEKPPYRGELGSKIFENVSQKAWDEWKEMEIKVLNEYRLVLADPKQYQQLVDTMLSFLGFSDGDLPEVENSERGR